jgi:hypothetical protein
MITGDKMDACSGRLGMFEADCAPSSEAVARQ